MMNFTTGLFCFFSFILVASALRVVSSSNPVESALFFILCLFNASGIWLIFGAEFLSMLLIMLYVGAVMVLFLFIVMMLNLRFSKYSDQRQYKIAAFMIGILIFFEMQLIVAHAFHKPVFFINNFFLPISKERNYLVNTMKLGEILFSRYIFAFEVVGLLILLAILASVSLATAKSFTRKRQVSSSN